MAESVQSVERALTILELLSEHNDGLGVTEISVKTNLHKSTVHRLLKALIAKDFVVQEEVNNLYKVSMKLYEMGSKKIVDIDILKASKPYTRDLMNKLNEIVHLVIRDNTDIIYIDKVEADNTIRMASRVGQRSPMYCTSVGKSMLAFMDNKEVKEVWDASEIIKLTQNTIISFNEFKEELIKIRQLGYAVDNEENELGVRCIGATIFNQKGEVEGAISISGPANRIPVDRVEYIAMEVKKCADLISKDLGYRG